MLKSQASAQRRSRRGERPLAITILCILFFIVMPLSIMILLIKWLDGTANYGGEFTPYFLASTLLTLVSFVGLWFMQKWGLFLYGALFLIGNVSGYFWGFPITIAGIAVPVVVFSICACYLPRMR